MECYILHEYGMLPLEEVCGTAHLEFEANTPQVIALHLANYY